MRRYLRPVARAFHGAEAKDSSLFLNEDQAMLRETLRNFANNELKPYAGQWDATKEYPREAIKKMADMGLMGFFAPHELGGSDMDYTSYAITARYKV